jgi:hypothetical protein
VQKVHGWGKEEGEGERKEDGGEGGEGRVCLWQVLECLLKVRCVVEDEEGQTDNEKEE